MNFIFTHTPLKFIIEPLWRDEAFSYLLAKKNPIQILLLTAKDFNPPLYYLILKFWITLFGSSEIALRSLSFVFYCTLIYVADHILIDIFKIKSKLKYIYLLLFAINPVLTYYAFEARMYTMFAFFVALSSYTLLTKKYTLYFWSTILGLYTHYFMLLVLTFQFVYIYLSEKKKFEIKNFSLVIKPFLFFLPWFLFFFLNRIGQQNTFWILPTKIKDFIYLPGRLYLGYEKEFTFEPFALFNFIIGGILILCSYLIFSQKKKNNTAIYLGLWTFFPSLLIFFISLFFPYFIIRYLIFCSVGITLLLIYLTEHVNKTIKYICIILLFIVTIQYQNLQIKGRERKWPAVTIKEIKPLLEKNDVLYITSDLDFFVAQYYLGEEKVYIYDTSYNLIPDYVGKTLITQANIAKALPTYPHKAFVLGKDGHYTIQSIY